MSTLAHFHAECVLICHHIWMLGMLGSGGTKIDQAMKTSGGGAILGERTRGREKVVKLVGSLFLE